MFSARLGSSCSFVLWIVAALWFSSFRRLYSMSLMNIHLAFCFHKQLYDTTLLFYMSGLSDTSGLEISLVYFRVTLSHVHFGAGKASAINNVSVTSSFGKGFSFFLASKRQDTHPFCSICLRFLCKKWIFNCFHRFSWLFFTSPRQPTTSGCCLWHFKTKTY